MGMPSSGALISQDSLVVVSQDQVSSDLAGESVILNLKNGTYYGLNELGSVIWEFIQQPKTVAAICDSILEDYEVDSETCTSSVQALLSDLVNAQLVEIRNEVDS
jgi:Coenzyme PQQ synthesis protein D (PqqD)